MIRTLTLGIVWVAVAAWAGLACAQPKPGEPKFGQETQLFDGKNLEGWGFHLVDPKLKLEDAWSVKDGILVSKGNPKGYLTAKQDFKDFKLVVEWRWAPGKEPGNSGVFLRIAGEPKAPPKCVEVQLKHGNAGDILAFRGFKLKSDADRLQEVKDESMGPVITVKRIAAAEKPPGEWNQCSMTLDGGRLTVELNGQMVNYATECEDIAGKIGFQSEGGEVHFRTIKLLPILK